MVESTFSPRLLHFPLRMRQNHDLRHEIAKGSDLDAFQAAVESLKARLEPFHLRQREFELPEELREYTLSQPPWICQPYVRPPPEEHLKKMQEIRCCSRNEDERKAYIIIWKYHHSLERRKRPRLRPRPRRERARPKRSSCPGRSRKRWRRTRTKSSPTPGRTAGCAPAVPIRPDRGANTDCARSAAGASKPT